MKCLQCLCKTSSCLACLEVAGQDAAGCHSGLEWPSQIQEGVCDSQLMLSCWECWRSLTPGEPVPAALRPSMCGTETRKIHSVGSHRASTVPSCAPKEPSQPQGDTPGRGCQGRQGAGWQVQACLCHLLIKLQGWVKIHPWCPCTFTRQGWGSAPDPWGFCCHKSGSTYPIISPGALPCCLQLGWIRAWHTTVIPWSHQHPSGVSAHPKALLHPGSWEQRDRLGCVWLAEGTPEHLLWVMEMGQVCGLGHHLVGCSLPEGVCVPMGE